MLPTPHGHPESGPSFPSGPEVPRATGPESQPTLERPAPQEQRTGAGAGDTPPPPAPVVPLPPAPATHASSTTTVRDTTNPSVAADEDLIEKEWVEKAKKIISETKHDPYAQEQAVTKLQADYLNKRYGKVIKLPPDVHEE